MRLRERTGVGVEAGGVAGPTSSLENLADDRCFPFLNTTQTPQRASFLLPATATTRHLHFVVALPSLSVWCSDYAAQLTPSYRYRFSLTACVSPVVCFRTYVHDEWLCAGIAAGSGPMIDQPGSMPFWKGTKTGRRCRNAMPIRPLFVLYPIYSRFSYLAQDWLYENWDMQCLLHSLTDETTS